MPTQTQIPCPATPANRRRSKLIATTLATLLATSTIFAASTTFTLTATDATSSSSFTTWNVSGGGSSAPAAGTGGDTNDYFTGAFTLRTPIAAGDYTFGGDSLTVQTGGQFAIKGAAGSTVTVNNLILDGGQLNIASGTTAGSPTFTLAGAISVTSNGGLLRAFSNGTSGSSSKQVLDITAAISGTGPLSIDLNASSNNSRGTVRLSAANSYSGELKVLNNPYVTALLLNNTDALKFATLTVENTGGTGVGFSAGAGTYNVGALQGAVSTGTIATTTGVILSVGAKNTSTSFAGVISGVGSLTKVGTGTMTLSGVNTYTGATVINNGTLALGAANALASGTALTLGGGTFALGGFSQSAFTNALTMTAGSTLDFGSHVGGLTLTFADSHSATWTGTLTLLNFTVGTDNLNFTSASGLGIAQLGEISLAGYTATGLDGSGNVQFMASAIPEPSTCALLAGLAGLACVIGRRRRA